jgi:hypothetical protein
MAAAGCDFALAFLAFLALLAFLAFLVVFRLIENTRRLVLGLSGLSSIPAGAAWSLDFTAFSGPALLFT